jgi:hypothetical protein
LSDSGDRGACSDGRDIRMSNLAFLEPPNRILLGPANHIVVIEGATDAVVILDLHEQQSSCCDREEQ